MTLKKNSNKDNKWMIIVFQKQNKIVKKSKELTAIFSVYTTWLHGFRFLYIK